MAMTRSTFAGFTTAQLALAASQRALDVTGQNISNINKSGYTRQRLDLASISPTGASYFMAQTDCRVGQGVEMTGVIQIRDPFLDIQYRNQLAKVGTVDTQDNVLSQIGEIFDEIDMVAVRANLTEIVSRLDEMSQPNNANQGASDTLVRSSIETFLNIVHEHASTLSTVRKDAIADMETLLGLNRMSQVDEAVSKVNTNLDEIAKINKQIEAELERLGKPLDESINLAPVKALLDKRDGMLADLSKDLGVTITPDAKDPLQISVEDPKDNTSHLLFNVGQHGEVNATMGANGTATLGITTLDGNSVGLDETKVSTDLEAGIAASGDNEPDKTSTIESILSSIVELNKSIKSTQILGGGALELQDQRNSLIDELAQYIPITVEYEDLNLGSGIKVDTLKISMKNPGGDPYVIVDDTDQGHFSFTVGSDGKASVNVAHLTTDAQGNVITEDADITKTLDDGEGVLKGYLDALNKSGGFDSPSTDFKGIGYYEKMFDAVINTFATTLNKLNMDAGGNALFDTTDGGDFTASNTKVTEDWIAGKTKIVTAVDNTKPDSTANVNALKMINAINSDKLQFKGPNGYVAFEGTIFTAYDTIQSMQASDRKASDAILSNRTSVLNEIADNKDSVSGVYMDEEVMNLMRYQQSYNAAARLMTTLDEALNTLINNTGVVGR